MEKDISELEVLIGKIDEAMVMTEGFEKNINEKRELIKTKSEKGEDIAELEADIANREDDKSEFDEMTVNALKKAYKDLQVVKETELEEFKKEHEHKKTMQETRKARLAQYSKEIVSLPKDSEEAISLSKKIHMLETTIRKEDENIQKFLKESIAKQAKIDEYGEKIKGYAIKLNAMDEVIINAETKVETSKENKEQITEQKQNKEQITEQKDNKEQTAETKREEQKQEQVDPKQAVKQNVASPAYINQNNQEKKQQGELSQEELREEETNMLQNMASITQVKFSASRNEYIYEGINKNGDKTLGVIKALNKIERREIFKKLGLKNRFKMDPNLYRIFSELSSSSKECLDYYNAIQGKTEMANTKVLYDFRENGDEKLTLFEKLRAHRDARRSKNLATIIDKKGNALFKGEEVELLEKGQGKLAIEQNKKMDVRVAEYSTDKAIEAYKKTMEDPARNVKDNSARDEKY